MTETEKKALALVKAAVSAEQVRILPTYVDKAVLSEALFLAIEQHEAFRQEVSDAVEAVFAGYHDAPIPWVVMRGMLEPFILPKPDPLVEALNEALLSEQDMGAQELADNFRAALAKRGGRIVWGGEK